MDIAEIVRDRMAMGPMGGTAIPRGKTLHMGPGKTGGGKQTPTHFTDGKGAGIASVDLGRTTPWKVKQLHQARHHLILLLCMAQSAVATKTPGEDSLL